MTIRKFLTNDCLTLFKSPVKHERSANPWSDIAAAKLAGTEQVTLVATTFAKAFDDIERARNARVELVVGEKLVDVSGEYKNYLLVRAQHTITHFDAEKALRELAKTYEYRVPREIPTIDAAVEDIRSLIPSGKLDNGMDRRDAAAFYLREFLTDSMDRVLDEIRVRDDNPNIEKAPDDAEGMMELARTAGTVIALGWDMGAGKSSQFIEPMHAEAAENGKLPILLSPRRSHHAAHTDHPHHYENIKADPAREASGAMGTTNAICGHGAFAKYRHESQHVQADEFEQTLSHNVSAALKDKSLEGRGLITDTTWMLLRRSANEGVLAVSDALLSEHTVNELHRQTGKKIHYSRGHRDTTRRKMKLHRSHEQALKNAQDQAANGKRVVIFADMSNSASKSDLEGMLIAMQSATTGKCQRIDRSWVEDNKNREALKHLNKVIESAQVTIISPVFSSNVSITTDQVDAVFIMCSGTVLPTEVIQTTRRFRKVDVINISFEVDERLLPANASDVLQCEAAKEKRAAIFGPELLNDIRRSPGVEMVLNQIARQNRMRRNYANKVLIMAEHLGFELEHVKPTAKTEDNKTLSDGKNESEEQRAESVLAAEDISEMDVQRKRDKGSLTWNEQYQIEAFDLRAFFKTCDLDHELIQFDKNGHGRRVIRNWMTARKCYTYNMTAEAMQKRKIIRKALDCAGINMNEIQQTVVTSTESKAFADWVRSGEMTINKQKIQVRRAIRIFSGMRASLSSTALLQKILGEFLGLEIDAENKKSTTYTVTEPDQLARYYTQAMSKKVAKAFVKPALVKKLGRVTWFQRMTKVSSKEVMQGIVMKYAQAYRDGLFIKLKPVATGEWRPSLLVASHSATVPAPARIGKPEKETAPALSNGFIERMGFLSVYQHKMTV